MSINDQNGFPHEFRNRSEALRTHTSSERVRAGGFLYWKKLEKQGKDITSAVPDIKRITRAAKTPDDARLFTHVAFDPGVIFGKITKCPLRRARI